jgi:hypothetical protein
MAFLINHPAINPLVNEPESGAAGTFTEVLT